jgi:hypothetical protein
MRLLPFRFPLLLPGATLACLALSGCYTQLATRDYAAVETPSGYAYAEHGADSLRSQAAPGAADTLAPRSGAPTVIVNNYYDPSPSYRGHAHWEWDYPLLSFGYYSSRFDHYSRPWWWDDPGYHRYGRHRSRVHHVHSVAPRPIPGPDTPRQPSPYKSDTRLYSPAPDYPGVRKGRRADPPPAQVSTPAPAAQPSQPQPAQQAPSDPAPAPKASTSSDPARQPAAGTPKEDDHPTLRKGRRR